MSGKQYGVVALIGAGFVGLIILIAIAVTNHNTASLEARLVDLEQRHSALQVSYPAAKSVFDVKRKLYPRHWTQELATKSLAIETSISQGTIQTGLTQARTAQADGSKGNPNTFADTVEGNIKTGEDFVFAVNDPAGLLTTLSNKSTNVDAQIKKAETAISTNRKHINTRKEDSWNKNYRLEFNTASGKLTTAQAELDTARQTLGTLLVDDYVLYDKIQAYDEAVTAESTANSAKDEVTAEEADAKAAVKASDNADTEIDSADTFVSNSYYNSRQADAKLVDAKNRLTEADNYFWGDSRLGIAKDYDTAKTKAEEAQALAKEAVKLATPPTAVPPTERPRSAPIVPFYPTIAPPSYGGSYDESGSSSSSYDSSDYDYDDYSSGNGDYSSGQDLGGYDDYSSDGSFGGGGDGYSDYDDSSSDDYSDDGWGGGGSDDWGDDGW